VPMRIQASYPTVTSFSGVVPELSASARMPYQCSSSFERVDG
jgi:hypothetical protein